MVLRVTSVVPDQAARRFGLDPGALSPVLRECGDDVEHEVTREHRAARGA